jgi:hypothetical protein
MKTNSLIANILINYRLASTEVQKQVHKRIKAELKRSKGEK